MEIPHPPIAMLWLNECKRIQRELGPAWPTHLNRNVPRAVSASYRVAIAAAPRVAVRDAAMASSMMIGSLARDQRRDDGRHRHTTDE